MADRITAMDVEKQEFTRKVRGYDPDEVRIFLSAVAEEVGRLNLENADLRDQMGRLQQASQGYERRERQFFSATCNECGKEARLPFEPRLDRPVYCSDCFELQRGGSSRSRSGGNRW